MPTAKGVSYYRRKGLGTGRNPEHGAYVPLDVFKSLDRRSLISKDLHHYQKDFLNALGGTDSVSPQIRVLVDRACVILIKVRMMEAAILSGKSIEDHVYLAWVNSLRRLLETIGLTRKAREMGVLEPIDPHVQAVMEAEKENNQTQEVKEDGSCEDT